MARSLLSLIAVTVALLGTAAAPAGGGGAGPGGRLLYVTNGDRLTSLEVTSGKRVTRRVSVAGCGPDLYLTGGHVVFGEFRKGRTIVYSVPAELDRKPRRLGTAHAFVPSAVDGRVWLSGTVCTSTRKLRARELTVGGEVTATGHRLPTEWLLGAVEDGLLIGRRRSTLVWDPESGRTVRRLDALDWVGGYAGNRVAGCVEGTRCRSLALVDAGTGATVTTELERPLRFGGSFEFSPDRSHIAATLTAKRRWSVALVNVSDGSITVIPGSGTGRQYPELAWSSTSGWLYFRAERERVMAYRPGEERAIALPFRLPRQAVHLMAY